MRRDAELRVYRHAATGEEVHLIAAEMVGSGAQRWCALTLERADGGAARIAGQHLVEWWSAPEAALRGYRKRIRALLIAGYRRVR